MWQPSLQQQDDIIERLALNSPAVFVRGFDRPNLKFFVRANLKKKERIEEALRIVKSIEGSGIIYAITRKETEELVRFFKENDVKAAAYHAGMTGDKRSKIQNDFMENKFKVIVATIAFGMGVDKADIRFVIHVGMPSSPEGYYQEAGRAGRDGENAFCILLHSKSDASLHHFFIMTGRSEMSSQGKNWADAKVVTDIKYARLDKMKQYVNLETCRRLLLLEYFGDPAVKNHSGNCRGCDVCLKYKWEKSEVSTDGKKAKIRVKKSPGYLGGTILETANLYKQKYSPEKIAKIRSLGISTIFNHLTEWYINGGEFIIDDFLKKEEEEKILQAIKKIGSYEKLSPLKSILPPEISYEKIRMAIAKMLREKI